jgi:hypothetical protein
MLITKVRICRRVRAHVKTLFECISLIIVVLAAALPPGFERATSCQTLSFGAVLRRVLSCLAAMSCTNGRRLEKRPFFPLFFLTGRLNLLDGPPFG